MRINPLILIAAGSLVTAAPAVAAEATPPAQAQQDDQSKVVCRKEAETGSLLKKRRVCYTKRQWEQAGQASRDAMTHGQMSGGSSGN